ncbi:hypothetical protein HanXRQr2_Chr16g0727361 [Helianthus annuus]|uniref:Uncharacterized protein n=1 Tax=Helianthus annuus TaxID=4232 RepID=A0A9K3DQB9_HELAN|nr:hypothetical protein HanXRQr2_Chr16g0727361 [Helianthus annuus]
MHLQPNPNQYAEGGLEVYQQPSVRKNQLKLQPMSWWIELCFPATHEGIY